MYILHTSTYVLTTAQCAILLHLPYIHTYIHTHTYICLQQVRQQISRLEQPGLHCLELGSHSQDRHLINASVY